MPASRPTRSRFFSDAYRKLAEDVQNLRQTCQRYSNRDFRNSADQRSKSNEKQFGYWREAAGIDAPATIDLEDLISGMELAAEAMDSALTAKAANLTLALDIERLSAGDKSVLALALLLAQCNADPDIMETIVVLETRSQAWTISGGKSRLSRSEGLPKADVRTLHPCIRYQCCPRKCLA